MLKSPKLKYDLELMGIMSIIGLGGTPKEIEAGIFISPNWSFDAHIAEPHENYPDFDFEMGDPYGVCDEIEQVKTAYAKYFNDPVKAYCISFCKVVKAEQSQRGGWRWHKWGRYIGTKEPAYEYLYDEGDEIQEVYCYHIYELLDEAVRDKELVEM